MRILLGLLIFLFLTGDALARKRPRVVVQKTVYGEQRPIAAHPYGVEFILSSILCQFARYSVPPGQQAGSCTPRPEPRARWS